MSIIHGSFFVSIGADNKPSGFLKFLLAISCVENEYVNICLRAWTFHFLRYGTTMPECAWLCG